jgi:serine protease Do
MKRLDLKSLLVGLALSAVILVSAVGGALADRVFVIKPLDFLVKRDEIALPAGMGNTTNPVPEENVVVSVAENTSPSVVTVSAQAPARRVLNFNPFGGFSSSMQGGEPQDIGSGFVVSGDGLIVTNKHVVSDASATYKVITKDGKEYEVKQISRDPANDIAVLKIDPPSPTASEGQVLRAVELGESSNLKVGQFVIAIGTALGEFRHTVTTGVISGLGRGITAGSAYEGFVEKLDDVIQTDAAINPGNSGGPLIDSSGQVIGINVAIASGAQNIAFAIPIDLVKSQLATYSSTGKFPAKAFLGVQYQMVSSESAILNSVPQGAYVTDVVAGSPAESAGLKVGDIITKLDGVEIKGEDGLSSAISSKKVGDSIAIDIWNDGVVKTLHATLAEFEE